MNINFLKLNDQERLVIKLVEFYFYNSDNYTFNSIYYYFTTINIYHNYLYTHGIYVYVYRKNEYVII